ncbi:MAG: VanZ family protein [Clostridiales bacterium]|nr:VanZ family protein [Clostridiales bacterium]
MAARNKRKRIFWTVLFLAYLVLLFYFLFFSEGFGRGEMSDGYRMNLTLFREIKRFITYRDILGRKTVMINLAGNVIAFLPFGILWPIVRDYKTNWFFTTLTAFALSLAAELLQLIFKIGSFDVDDLLLNTAGAVVGYLICAAVHRHRVKRKGTARGGNKKKKRP